MKEKNAPSNQRKRKTETRAPFDKAPKKRRFAPAAILTGSFLEREGLMRQLPFILYLCLLLIIYIANSYYGEKTVYKIEGYKSEMLELRSEYISAKSRLMTSTNLSKVSQKLKSTQVAPSHTPPGKIFVKSQNE